MICSGPIRDNLAVARRPGVDIIDVKTTKQQATDRAVTILGPVLAIAVAWATATLRSDMSIANAALALAFVCVAAALARPLAGFLTSAVAALALNYFHTVPVHSLRMTDGDEILTVVLLVLLGSSVSVATTMRVARQGRRPSNRFVPGSYPRAAGSAGTRRRTAGRVVDGGAIDVRPGGFDRRVAGRRAARPSSRHQSPRFLGRQLRWSHGRHSGNRRGVGASQRHGCPSPQAADGPWGHHGFTVDAAAVRRPAGGGSGRGRTEAISGVEQREWHPTTPQTRPSPRSGSWRPRTRSRSRKNASLASTRPQRGRRDGVGARGAGRGLRRHRHQPAVLVEGGVHREVAPARGGPDQRLRRVFTGLLVPHHHHLDQVSDAGHARRQQR